MTRTYTATFIRNTMEDFTILLEKSINSHGHLCAGQVIGVRMAMLGCRLIGIENPGKESSSKKLNVYVEIDRCAADAIASVTGCSIGKRTLKFLDFGIYAATFINLGTMLAYRLIATERSRELAADYAPAEDSSRQQQIIGYQKMPDALLFDIQQVQLAIPEEDMAVTEKKYTFCERCGQKVRDGKELLLNTQVVCRSCSDHSYFRVVDSSVECPGGPAPQHGYRPFPLLERRY